MALHEAEAPVEKMRARAARVGGELHQRATAFAREPDSFLGYLALGLTMGQWLSVPMIAIGIALLIWSYRRAGETTKADSAGS